MGGGKQPGPGLLQSSLSFPSGAIYSGVGTSLMGAQDMTPNPLPIDYQRTPAPGLLTP